MALIHSNLHLARVSVVAYAKWRLSFNVSEYKHYTLSFRWVETSARDVPSCSHSCRALALERAKAHIAITAARYTRQETLPALLLRYCPIFSLSCSAFLFPLKHQVELRRPSRYMEARVYMRKLGYDNQVLVATTNNSAAAKCWLAQPIIFLRV